jgi:two-component system, NarL family, response regulator DevR
MTRVMLVDDHEIVRDGLRGLLSRQDDMEVVAEASTAAEAVLRARSYKPDVIIMDLRLPDGSGVTACRDILSERPSTSVLMLTSYPDDQAVLDAIMAGASGYLLKQIRSAELLDGIRRVAAGESLLDPKVTAAVLQRVRSPHGSDDPRLARLTPTELRILELIADGKTNRQIGDEIHLAEKTIKNYVSSILAKLQVVRRAEAAAYLADRRAREHSEYS